MNKFSDSDLLLIDFFLPDGTAWDILEKIKTNEMIFNGRIVLMPGLQPNQEDKKLIKKFNPFGVIVKPLEVTDLSKLLG